MKCNLKKKINFTKFKNITPRAIMIQIIISEALMEKKYIQREYSICQDYFNPI